MNAGMQEHNVDVKYGRWENSD